MLLTVNITKFSKEHVCLLLHTACENSMSTGANEGDDILNLTHSILMKLYFSNMLGRSTLFQKL